MASEAETAEDRIERLEVVLGTLISWLPQPLGLQAQSALLEMLQAPHNKEGGDAEAQPRL